MAFQVKIVMAVGTLRDMEHNAPLGQLFWVNGLLW